MSNTLSHTFSFQSKNNFSENILYITEEDENRHYLQYMQYSVVHSKEKIFLDYSQVNIKVDRSYYLEVANISIDNETRERHLFSVLGHRRFGANSKRIDYYLLDKSLDTEKLDEVHKNFYETQEKEVCYTQHNENSVNSYKVFPVAENSNNIILLEQLNVTKRKKINKSYFIELSDESYAVFLNLPSPKMKVNYLFSEIGKIYFNSLSVDRLEIEDDSENIKDLAISKLKKYGFEMEMASRVNDNSVFRTLKEKSKKIEDVYSELYSRSYALMNNPDDENTIHLFSVAIVQFGIHTREIKKLEEITSYFTTIQMLAESGSISYLLTKHDPDFRDIFLYMLETLSIWNRNLSSLDDDVREFNMSTIDLHDSLRHLVDVCLKFKHEYQCQDADMVETLQETGLDTYRDGNLNITSAKEYFNEVELEYETYEELIELENDISELSILDNYDEDLNNRLINFFEGYVRVLNPLFEFKDLSYSLSLLSKKLEEFEVKENGEILLILLKGLVNDLLEWKQTVLVERTAEDIHYMNKSFYSNIAQIEILIEQRGENMEDELIEFF